MSTISAFRQQLKNRRLELGLKQKDMFERTGLSRQQYQQIEKKGNPSLETLLLIAQGLDCDLVIVPKNENDLAVKNDIKEVYSHFTDDPWQGLLE